MRGKDRVRAVTFLYHGVARGEVEASKAIAAKAGVEEHRFVRLPDIKEAADIGSRRFAGLPRTYIPMRNSIFYSVAAGIAEEVGADLIVGGHNRDDRKIFVDAGPRFFGRLNQAMWAGSKILLSKRTKIVLPLASKSKVEVVKLADSLGVPLGLTWSCHRSGTTHCWKCEGCTSRMNAFENAGVPDPLRVTQPRKIT